MKPRPVNLAASVHQRLLNQARATDRPFNEILQYFAMDRFLYRLAKSPRGGSFVLKGGLLLALWRVSVTRATKDIDLLGHVPNDVDGVVILMRDTQADGCAWRRSRCSSRGGPMAPGHKTARMTGCSTIGTTTPAAGTSRGLNSTSAPRRSGRAFWHPTGMPSILARGVQESIGRHEAPYASARC